MRACNIEVCRLSYDKCAAYNIGSKSQLAENGTVANNYKGVILIMDLDKPTLHTGPHPQLQDHKILIAQRITVTGNII